MFTKLTDSKQIFHSLCALGSHFSAVPVVVCIGSDRVIGDAFGPLVGECLIHRYNANAFVYGSLARPVTALNLCETLRFIRLRHPRQPVLAIDSALGSSGDIGSFRVFLGGLKPGIAVGKNLPSVGDVSLTATVGSQGAAALVGIRLGLVAPLAESAALAIAQFLSLLPKTGKTHANSTTLLSY